jgi:hypothetical protein
MLDRAYPGDVTQRATEPSRTHALLLAEILRANGYEFVTPDKVTELFNGPSDLLQMFAVTPGHLKCSGIRMSTPEL